VKKIPIKFDTGSLPSAFLPYLKGGELYDSSSSPEAKVIYIKKRDSLYLKIGEQGTLKREAELYRYFHTIALSPAVLEYCSEDKDYLLTASADGKDCTEAEYLSNPGKLAATIGEALRKLHSTDAPDCPAPKRTEEYIESVFNGYSQGRFDSSIFLGKRKFKNAEEAIKLFDEGKNLLKQDCLIHGDYCLPNIILKDFKLSSFIDLGNGGIADRHIDIFWGAWTLFFNLHTNKYKDIFFDAYGRDAINQDILTIIEAAECFG